MKKVGFGGVKWVEGRDFLALLGCLSPSIARLFILLLFEREVSGQALSCG